MKAQHLWKPTLFSAIVGLTLAACGGGGSDSSGSVPNPSGLTAVTVATGAAVSGAAVSAKCAAGTVPGATTNASGVASLDFTQATMPCLVQASFTQGSPPAPVKMHSLIPTAKAFNITPLTESVTAEALRTADVQSVFNAPSTARLTAGAANTDAAIARVRTVLTEKGVNTDALGDPIYVTLVPQVGTTAGNAHDDLLEAVKGKFSAIADVVGAVRGSAAENQAGSGTAASAPNNGGSTGSTGGTGGTGSTGSTGGTTGGGSSSGSGTSTTSTPDAGTGTGTGTGTPSTGTGTGTTTVGGGGGAVAVAAKVSAGQIQVTGKGARQNRTYNFRLPAAATPEAGHPLIIWLHGDGGSADIPNSLVPWADGESAILLALQGMKVGDVATWRFRLDGRENATAENVQPAQGVDDVQFISDVIDIAIDGGLVKKVDATKVFVIGYSRGAGMAFFAYADSRTKNKIAAIAPISGTFYCDLYEPRDPPDRNGNLNALPIDADGTCGALEAPWYNPKDSLFDRQSPARILGIWGTTDNGEFPHTQFQSNLDKDYPTIITLWAHKGTRECQRVIRAEDGRDVNVAANVKAKGYRQLNKNGNGLCAEDIIYLLDQNQGHVPTGYDEKIVKWFFNKYNPLP